MIALHIMRRQHYIFNIMFAFNFHISLLHFMAIRASRNHPSRS